MKFILKDGLIHIVDNKGFYNNNIEVEVEIPGLEPTRVDYKIAGGEYKTLKDNKMTIQKEYLNSTKLEIVVRVFIDKDVHYFKSDAIPLTQAVLFGGTVEDYYPAVIKDLQHKVNSLFSALVNVKEFADDQARITRHELKHTMVELVDTFEEITKKGSLF